MPLSSVYCDAYDMCVLVMTLTSVYSELLQDIYLCTRDKLMMTLIRKTGDGSYIYALVMNLSSTCMYCDDSNIYVLLVTLILVYW